MQIGDVTYITHDNVYFAVFIIYDIAYKKKTDGIYCLFADGLLTRKNTVERTFMRFMNPKRDCDYWICDNWAQLKVDDKEDLVYLWEPYKID